MTGLWGAGVELDSDEGLGRDVSVSFDKVGGVTEGPNVRSQVKFAVKVNICVVKSIEDSMEDSVDDGAGSTEVCVVCIS